MDIEHKKYRIRLHYCRLFDTTVLQLIQQSFVQVVKKLPKKQRNIYEVLSTKYDQL